jgi:hypothetical protein
MASSVTGFATPIPPEPLPREADRRFRRLRGLAWFLDRSIPIGKWRIGLDPIIGLLPGIGDWIGSLLSLYVLYEGARLGMPARILTRMTGNILVETVIGSIPLVGDLFDFAWQANTRNMQLIEQHYRPGYSPRSLHSIWLAVLFVTLVVLALGATLVVAVFELIEALFRG